MFIFIICIWYVLCTYIFCCSSAIVRKTSLPPISDCLLRVACLKCKIYIQLWMCFVRATAVGLLASKGKGGCSLGCSSRFMFGRLDYLLPARRKIHCTLNTPLTLEYHTCWSTQIYIYFISRTRRRDPVCCSRCSCCCVSALHRRKWSTVNIICLPFVGWWSQMHNSMLFVWYSASRLANIIRNAPNGAAASWEKFV